jgi:sec-independent protein translocase protein TatB
MIEISLGKLVLLALVALLVLGPEKLPGAARTAGALMRRLRTGWDSVRAEVERELEIEEIKKSARDAVARAEAAQADVNDALNTMRKPFSQAAASAQAEAGAIKTDVMTPTNVMTSTKPSALEEPPHGGD